MFDLWYMIINDFWNLRHGDEFVGTKGRDTHIVTMQA
jgi:hypothetical protein